LERLLKGPSKKKQSRRQARRQFFEQLERRDLMALNIVSVSPLDGATEVPVDSNLVVTFNANVAKGQGNIYVLQKSTNAVGLAIDVRSPSVTISGAQVTIDPPTNLLLDNSYFVLIDDGAFIDTSSNPTTGATLLTQNFDYQALGPQVFETAGNGINDWTATPPDGFSVEINNPAMVGVGLPEWRGWTFARKDFWTSVDGQDRPQFNRGTGNIAVADTDEYDDGNGAVRPFQSTLKTKAVDLTGVAANSVKLEFDSSFRPENSQIGRLAVSYDGGTTFTQLLELNPSNTDNDSPWARGNMNERLVTGGTTGGGTPIGSVDNPTSGSLVFSFYTEGGNDWWWALDNLKVTGDIVGVPFGGVSDPLFWEFSTPVPLGFAVTIDKGYISENGGTAVGTVTRTAQNISGEVVVTLTSSDTSEATVPASVTIPDGVRSVTFPITAVDDSLFDRTQVVTVTATTPNYVDGVGIIRVTDDEGPDVVSVVPADNATDAYYRTNLIVNFNTNVKKGSGRLHIVETSTGVLGETIDINSANVTISGAKVTINPTADLKFQTNYHILFDDGAILDTSSTLVPGTLLLSETFDLLPLGPFVNETGGDGTDFTFTPPLGYSIDNSLMPTGSTSEFNGWSFMDKNSWIAASNDGSGNVFTRGSGTVAVADPDEFFDKPNDGGFFNSFLTTAPVNLSGVTPGSVSFAFDSSFRRGGAFPFGQVEVSYNNGSTWDPFLFFGDSNNPNDGRNERITITSATAVGSFVGGATVQGPLNSPASGQLRFRFSVQSATNANMWWAIDNLAIRGQVTGEPYAGIEDPTAWNFRTGVLPVLTVSVSPGSISENGGTATGTVTRSQTDQGDLVVTLTSSDLTEATVPATVTIPDGAFSATFTITGVDDTDLEFPQLVTITATAPDFTTGSTQIVVADDDFGIVGVSPLPGDTNVPVDTNFIVVFNQPIRKGNGYLHLVRQSDGKAELSVNVNSPAVTIVNDTMFIDLPSNLMGQTAYYGLLDPGAVLTTLAQTTVGTTLLTQDFELLRLQPAVLEQVGLTPDGKDFTATPPQDWSVDNSLMPPGGAPEWTGWTFANKGFWQNQGVQGRANFTRGQGTIAIGDNDEWDDYARPTNNFNSLYSSNAIDLDAVEANSVVLEFDSSFRPEGTTPNPNNQIGTVQVSYDDGSTWSDLLVLDVNNTNGSSTATNVNERRSITVNNPDTGLMKFRWALTGTNDWWWAIDNIVVTGTTVNFPSPALSDPTVYTITTAEAATLTVDVPASAAEDAGTVSATVSRNLGTVGDVVVTLVSSNTAVGTVPATVTIPNGQSSVSFAITILDDAFFDGSQPLKITASATGFVSGDDLLTVTDNETGDVIITEIMYNPGGGSTQEQRNEWVEIYNNGTTTVDLSGWRLDDEDKQDWGRIASGSLLLPGEVAVLYNSLFGLNTDSLFRTDWKVPASAKVFGVAWSMEDEGSNKQRGGLFNSPAIGQEVLTLQDASNNNIDLVDFARDGGWPASPEGASIYVVNPGADNNVGTNWLGAVAGTDGAVRPSGSVFNNNDRGSPGRVTDNDVPAVTVSAATVSGNVLSVITNTGTWSDPNAGDTVTLTATLGDVVRNGDGTWNWSFTPSTRLTNQSVTITATDAGGLSSQVSFTVSSLVAVVNSKIYHRGSSFANQSVQAALDTSKVIAKSGATAQTLSYANLINTTRGINGLVFDVAGLAASSLTAADFGFRMSPTGAYNESENAPSSWAAAPEPTLIDVTPGTSTTPARVRLEWANNAIANRWLQIRLLANANTGLVSPEVYYVGHLYGEVNAASGGGVFTVTTADVTAIRPFVGGQASVSSIYDLDKNGVVSTADITSMRPRVGLNSLRVITIPPAGSADEGEGSAGRFGGIAAPGVESPKVGGETKDGGNRRVIEARMTDDLFDVPLPVSMVEEIAGSRERIPSGVQETESEAGDMVGLGLEAFLQELTAKRRARVNQR
jgi:hypothetical protein